MTPADVPDPKPGTTVTIEHLKGRASGGGSNYLNTAASCLDCNNRRSRQAQHGQRTIPRVVMKKRVEFTHAYTVDAEPDILVLFNSPLRRDEAMMAIRKRERQPVTLHHREALE
jgi:hypothetical protein